MIVTNLALLALAASVKASSLMAHTPTTAYKAPFDLTNPNINSIKMYEKYRLRYQIFYQMQAFLSVTEMPEKDEKQLFGLMETHFNIAVDNCPYLTNTHMKNELKEAMKGGGENAWTRAKAHKQTYLNTYNAMMKPDEPIPPGETNPDDYLVNKLLNRLFDEAKKKSNDAIL